MIRIDRGAERVELAAARAVRLPAITKIAATREPASDEITGYNVAKPALVRAQGNKCCYCEQQVEGKYDDIEHFRPKAGAVLLDFYKRHVNERVRPEVEGVRAAMAMGDPRGARALASRALTPPASDPPLRRARA